VLWSVQPAFLDAAFHAIEQDFGGLPRYLEGPLGLGPRELTQLRASLLEA
jgi:protein-tyrosine phosphatase